MIRKDERKNEKTLLKRIDPATTIIPFIVIILLCMLFVVSPEASTNALTAIRSFLGDAFGTYYLIIGLGVLIISLWIAFSDIGGIILGGGYSAIWFLVMGSDGIYLRACG